MPTNNKKTQTGLNSKNNSKDSTKKGMTAATMPSVPSARQRAKEMDVKRRSEAESNEL